MLLHVFSDTGQYLGRINSFISVSWTEEYIGKGKLAMYCYDTDETAKLLRHGYLLYRADRGTAMPPQADWRITRLEELLDIL